MPADPAGGLQGDVVAAVDDENHGNSLRNRG